MLPRTWCEVHMYLYLMYVPSTCTKVLVLDSDIVISTWAQVCLVDYLPLTDHAVVALQDECHPVLHSLQSQHLGTASRPGQNLPVDSGAGESWYQGKCPAGAKVKMIERTVAWLGRSSPRSMCEHVLLIAVTIMTIVWLISIYIELRT